MGQGNMLGSRAGQSVTSQSTTSAENTHYGALVEIGIDMKGSISHTRKTESPRTITVRSYDDGMKIGCTFVTNEAFTRLSRWHDEYMKSRAPKTHQQGE